MRLRRTIAQIVRANPINFSIKPEESKQAIAIAFQKFLNSLDFPIQIIMNTEQLNLEEYFKDFKARIKDSKKFKILFEGYKKHLESLTKENEVMNRIFYVIIPEKNDISIQLILPHPQQLQQIFTISVL
jgi:hypothetical protein